jgi:hypothetical protein
VAIPSLVIRSTVPAVLWAALTALLLLTPGDSLPSDLWFVDLLGPEIMEVLIHSVLFFVQAVLLVPAVATLVVAGGPPTPAAGVPDTRPGQLAVDRRPAAGSRSSRQGRRSMSRELARLGRGWGLVSFFSLSYALILELLQIPVPGRGFSWVDLVADAAGILLAWAVVEARRHLKL